MLFLLLTFTYACSILLPAQIGQVNFYTTSKRIANEPFFNPSNIYILDKENPKLDIEFLKIEPKPIDMQV